MKLDQYLCDIDKLKQYGFKKDKTDWIFSKQLDSMNIVIRINDELDEMQTDVFDAATNEKFLPFYQQQKSEYAANIVKNVKALQQDILDKCFTEQNIKEDLFNWCTKKWPDRELNTWEKFPKYVALKDKATGKWFALFANVKLSSLDKNQFKSDQEVWVVNVKLDDATKSTIDHKRYFPAFHMGKKNWVSILLDSKTNIPVTQELIKESYENATN